MERRLIPAILVLGEAAVPAAQQIAMALGRAEILGPQNRVASADGTFVHFGDAIRSLYEEGRPIIALCAAGIVIRALAPLLQNKRVEPPVLAVAEDGSAVVPLLGGLSGVNDMARQIAAALEVAPAITTSGELRFGINLLHPPAELTLANPDDAKAFMSNLLAGQKLRLDGQSRWLASSKLPFADDGALTISITPHDHAPRPDELIYHPRSVAIAADTIDESIQNNIEAALASAGIAPASVALLLAHEKDCTSPQLQEAAKKLDVPLRYVAHATDARSLVLRSVEQPVKLTEIEGLAIAVAPTPADVLFVGRKRGKLVVIGLGPGSRDLMTPAVQRELEQAEDILGYETYVRMAEENLRPFRADQTVHITDNREEMQRARHAFELAASGRHVVMVSSGDPGVFAMAAAVVEALHETDNPAWHGVELVIQPGISAAMAAASRIGAPLGHDFCIISLSDNLKPWEIIEKRLALAAEADLAMAFYNPISRARPHQLARALEILRQYRSSETPVVLGRDIGRPAETTRTTTLGTLTPDDVDMRTVVIVGSSHTQHFVKSDGREWVYTPRWYGKKPEK
ncbi:MULTISPECIES: precorrin-3B C(17)-methyltransferase [unclassified Ochrobactrum]|uniref:precorrin-3B C(17)-methyltransferase n=1 Tax=unclassified Ochrobactrum TaxID=239106 RepID=UPI000DF00247|nr:MULTISPECIES: precorrin-3B C(17)-methyltransferase [unclassified Ochrobactrum]MBQ0708609.1 precorrin-3B C(17)-methyltransferase [Ochrobactrum sp. AP1BH01-1]